MRSTLRAPAFCFVVAGMTGLATVGCQAFVDVDSDGTLPPELKTSFSAGNTPVAPLSRHREAEEVATSRSALEISSPGLVGVGVHINDRYAEACGGVAGNKNIQVSFTNGVCPGCGIDYDYTVTDRYDLLRVAWFGIHHDDPTGSNPRCDSDVRRTLLANYGAIFQGPCAQGATDCPTGIRHLWRRSDNLASTWIFTELLGNGASVGKFCNVNGGLSVGNGQVLGGVAKYGYDFQDNDPIRVNCLGNGLTTGYQVCGDAFQGHIGTLGTVLTIATPDPADVGASGAYPVGICTPGVFDAFPATRSTYTGVCPGGGASFGGKCFSGLYRYPDGTTTANCIVPFATGRCPTLTPAGTDCRGANLWLRKPNGDIVVDTSFGPASTAPPVPPAGRLSVGPYYRIHATTKPPNGTSVCAKEESDEQVACLVGQAQPCSLGFAERPARGGISVWDPNTLYSVATPTIDLGKVYEATEPNFSSMAPFFAPSRWTKKSPVLSCSGNPEGTYCWDRRPVGSQGVALNYPGTCQTGSCVGPSLDPNAENFVRGAVLSSESPRSFTVTVNPESMLAQARWTELGREFVLSTWYAPEPGQDLTQLGVIAADGSYRYIVHAYSGPVDAGSVKDPTALPQVVGPMTPGQYQHLLGTVYRISRDPGYHRAMSEYCLDDPSCEANFCRGKCGLSRSSSGVLFLGTEALCALTGAAFAGLPGAAIGGLACLILSWDVPERIEEFCETDCGECLDHLQNCCRIAGCTPTFTCTKFGSCGEGGKVQLNYVQLH